MHIKVFYVIYRLYPETLKFDRVTVFKNICTLLISALIHTLFRYDVLRLLNDILLSFCIVTHMYNAGVIQYNNRVTIHNARAR